ncbi:MAG: Coenzyme F420 hydrogenase/dehydrogenase, beta subunit C-terminal domain [Methanothrix sp.]|nr:Coenzyme F420 hydrogenase/dehydrogenase, beta subunit C-terminal domain [Methanothrix sp.]
MIEVMLQNPGLLPIQELESDVWARNICAGCRGCISVCPAGALTFDSALGRPNQITPCIDCKACLDVCPRLPANARIMDATDIIGPFIRIKNARSKQSSARFQKGGAVTALLAAALDEELVDCALVMGLDRWNQLPYPRVVRDSRELSKCAGSRYNSNSVLEPLASALKDVNAIALVGTPCAIQAVGLLRGSSNEFADRLVKKVRFTVGLFCFEAYDDSLITEITARLSAPPWRIDKMNAAGSEMQVTLRDGGQKSIPLSELAGHVKPGCRHCTDFTAKMADISVGSVGSAPGMSTVISRTEEGLGLLEIAEEMGFLEAEDGVNVEAVEKVGTLKLKRNGF